MMISKLALYKYINGGGGEDKHNIATRESYRKAYINRKKRMHLTCNSIIYTTMNQRTNLNLIFKVNTDEVKPSEFVSCHPRTLDP